MRDETRKMSESAFKVLGPMLAPQLAGLPADEQINALLRLACALACMATAAHRRNQHWLAQSKPEFYADATHMTASMLADLLPAPRGEDYKVELHPEVEAEMAADPDLKAGVTDTLAKLRQALDGVATGRFASVEEAMDSIGARTIDLDDDKGTLQ